MRSTASVFLVLLFLLGQAIAPESAAGKGTSAAKGTSPKSTKDIKTYSRFDILGRAKSPAIAFKLDSKYYKGKTIDSYPDWLLGNWGGHLKIYSHTQTLLARKLDPQLSDKTLEHLQPGRSLSLNFTFKKDGKSGKVKLEPVHGVVMVPADTANSVKEMMQKRNMSELEMSMMKEIMQSKKVPILFSFGLSELKQGYTGVTGGQISDRILSTVSRQLSDKCFEEQVICQQMNRTKTATTKGYTESVIWFKQHPDDSHLYVRAASIECSESGKLKGKIVFGGYLIKGKHVITDPNTIIHQSFK